MAKAYRAVLVAEQGVSRAPPLLILAETDAEAIAHAHRILGSGVSFDLLDGKRIVLAHQVPDAGRGTTPT